MVRVSTWLAPEAALAHGSWVKWIGGASNHDLQGLEDQAALATLAGAHCLDIAADLGVITAVKRGIAWALEQGVPRRPWLMLSLSDGVDPHFRKAVLIRSCARAAALAPAFRFVRLWPLIPASV